MTIFQKIINDTLKTPKTGKWSRKSLTMFVSFIMSIIIGIYIVISDYFLHEEINRYAIDVFYGFLVIAGGTSVLTVWDKMKNRRDRNNNDFGNAEELLDDSENYPEA
jgi:hypothetical protein